MAELVQIHIENTLPELEQMERIGLFSKDEIKKIIGKRTKLEYAHQKRKRTKEDFLKHIQYEINLLSLISKRRERLQCHLKRQEIDHAIATRINKMFRTVTLRFQNDVKLWLTQIEFCKRMRWHHTTSALFARMLQVHNNSPALWILAAKWEMEENNSSENARQLLQRALRYHPEHHHLWLEYFRMELMYTDMILKRRKTLGIEVDESDETIPDSVLDGTVASVVYKNATSKIEDVEFALSFLPICQQFDFTSQHIEDIFEDVLARYSNKEEVLDAVAKKPLLTMEETIRRRVESGNKKKHVISELENQVCQCYEETLENVSTTKMWSFYIEFYLGRLKRAKKTKKQNQLRSEVLSIMQRACDVDCLSSDLYVEWTHLLCAYGEEEAALSVSLCAARKWETKCSLWHMCLLLHIDAQVGTKTITALLNEALGYVKETDSFPLWQLGLQWLSTTSPSKLKEFFEQGIQKCKDVSLPLRDAYLEAAAMQEGIQAARLLYKRLTHMLPISAQLYKKMIQIENSQAKPSIKWLRKYYEDGVRQCGSYDIDLWLNMMRMEVEHPSGDPTLCTMIRWRAMKFLDDAFTEEFVTKVTLFATGHGLSMDVKDIM